MYIFVLILNINISVLGHLGLVHVMNPEVTLGLPRWPLTLLTLDSGLFLDGWQLLSEVLLGLQALFNSLFIKSR